ncbi:MAG: hypothetical protein LDLANPLL_00696 [Turneriella sp.]|nr:hypothetical protein [Turneriella sp.]
MKFERNDIFTGLFVIVGVVFALTVILFIAGYGFFDNRTEYWIRFEKLAGVKKGTPIRIKNFTIGEVSEVIPIYGSDLTFKAKARINHEFVIYQGTKLTITNQNVIGDAVIDLTPSLVKKYILKENDTLFATNFVNLEQMVDQISNLVATINKLVETFTALTGDNKEDVKMILTNLNGSIAKVNGLLGASQGEILAIMRNIRNTSVTLERVTKKLEKDPMGFLGSKNTSEPSHSAALP